MEGTTAAPVHWQVVHSARPATPLARAIPHAITATPSPSASSVGTEAGSSAVSAAAGVSDTIADSLDELLSPAPATTMPDLEGGPGSPPPRAASWRAALVSGAWGAVREFIAQGTGAMVGVTVRSSLAGGTPMACAAVGTLAAAAMGVTAYRSAELAGAYLYPDRDHAPLAARAALTAAPVLVAAAAVTCAVSSGTLVTAGAYLTGKLVQRCVRDFLSTVIADLVPTSEVVRADGAVVTKAHLCEEDWGRAIGNIVPTTGFFVLQDVFAAAPDPADGIAAGVPYVMATALVEVGRSFTGTLLCASVAHRQGRHLRAKRAGGLKKLHDNLRARKAFLQAADAVAMRQSIGILGDALAVVAGQPSRPLSRMIVKVLRSELKALGEFRGPLMTRGQLALERRQALLASAVATTPACTAPQARIVEVMGDSGVAYPDDDPPAVTIHMPPRPTRH